MSLQRSSISINIDSEPHSIVLLVIIISCAVIYNEIELVVLVLKGNIYHISRDSGSQNTFDVKYKMTK